jgi:hypothetical protein
MLALDDVCSLFEYCPWAIWRRFFINVEEFACSADLATQPKTLHVKIGESCPLLPKFWLT